MQYAISENEIPDELWKALLQEKIAEADTVEFNQLFKNGELTDEINALNACLTKKHMGKHKIYSGFQTYRYSLSESVIDFILSKQQLGWLNYEFEDFALLKGETEILATITHERYLFLLLDEEQRQYWNARGFDFGELFELQPKP